MRKIALAIVILALSSSVAMAGVVKYRDHRNDEHRSEQAQVEKKKSSHCEYKRGDDGKWRDECEEDD